MTGPGEMPARPDLVAGSATGSIYDLGYRRYDGPRLGRRHAVVALYAHSVRSAFGIGRGGRAKIAPFGLAAMVLLPALVAVAAHALAGPLANRLTAFSPPFYLDTVEQFIVFFVAAQAPELINRDIKSRVLTLYFSRALARDDYAVAKFLAMTTALSATLLVPQAVLMLGILFQSVDIGAGVGEVLPLLLPVLVTTVVASSFFAGVGLAIAAYAPRRAFAAGAIVIVFLVLSGIVQVVVLRGRLQGAARSIALLDPFTLLQGLAKAVFGDLRQSETGTDLVVRSGLSPAVFALATVVAALVSLAILLARYRRIEA